MAENHDSKTDGIEKAMACDNGDDGVGRRWREVGRNSDTHETVGKSVLPPNTARRDKNPL